MAKRLRIVRRKSRDTKPYVQFFVLNEDDRSRTVAEALDALNEREPLLTEDGKAADPIRFERSCMQKKCGACAMLIQGVPRLACSTRLSDIPGEVIELAPLRKFPCVADLITDRSIMQENAKTMKAWFTEETQVRNEDLEDTYEASRCLMCGCCLEVCPNFMSGDNFFGAAGMLAETRLLLSLPLSQRKALYKEYKKHIYSGCGKSLSCQDICPAEIPIENLMVRANALAIWKKY